MTDLLIEIAQTYLRYLMIGIGTWLVSRHVATADQAERLTTQLVEHLAIAAPLVIAVAWGTFKNVLNKRKVLTALLPNVTTENDLKAQLATGITPVISTPPDTRPGVPL